MKGYVITTGALFGLLMLAHIWRMVQEPHMVRDPWFLVRAVYLGRTPQKSLGRQNRSIRLAWLR